MILKFLALFNLWIIASGIMSPILLTLGFLSSLFVCFSIKTINDKLSLLGSKTIIKNSIKISLPLYCLWMVKTIIVSSISVLKNTWSIKINSSPRFVKTREIEGDIGSMIFCNSITLTPGTISLPKGIVHCYSKKDSIDIEYEEMRKNIFKLAIEKND